MFQKVTYYYNKRRFSNLNADDVEYLPDSQIINVRKGNSILTLCCIFKADIVDIDGITKDFVYLSGDPLVVENSVVEAIITALWDTVAGTSADGTKVTFGEAIIRADPNFFTIHKVEIIPLKKSIFGNKKKR